MTMRSLPSWLSEALPRRNLLASHNGWRLTWFLFLSILLLLESASPVLSYDYQQHQQHQQQQYGQYSQQQQYQQQQGASGYRAVLLEDVKALTLRKGLMTTARRVSPVKQLHCLSGCGESEPDVVQCVNMGSDGVAVQWRCEAELPSHLKFGLTQVSCEGFDYPDDPRVLHGSCGLQYSLVPVPGAHGGDKRKGAFKHQKQQYPPQQAQQGKREKESWLGRLLTWAIITYIAVLALRSCCCGTNRSAAGSGPTTGQTGGYYPPPPPSPPPPPPGSDHWGGGKGETGFGTAATPPPQPVPTWASAATGFGLGYLFGRRRTPATAAAGGGFAQPQQRFYDTPTAPNPWPRTDSGGSSGSGSRGGGDDTHTATAYASTSRR